MPAIAAVAIPAAAAIGGAVIKSRSESAARKAQERATAAALTHQTGRESLEDRRYNDAWADYQRRHAAWEARNFGGGGGNAAAAQVQGVPGQPINPQASMGAMGAGAQPQTLQQLAGAGAMGVGGPVTPDQAGSMADAAMGQGQQGQTLQDLSKWNDWKSLGLGG